MKTTLLSVALFLATASFAQAQVNSHVRVKGKSEIKSNKIKSDADASSEANLKANTIKSEHKAVAAENSSVSATANDKGKLISSIASDKSDASVQGKEKGKLISSIASDGKSESGIIHSDIKGSASAGTNSNVKKHVKNIKHSGKKIKASSVNTIQSGTAAVNAVKIKPVSVKANTGIGVHIQ